LVQGARPLFFLDYFGTGHLNPSVAADLVKGLAQGCRNTGCALIGGETAEMPDMYAADEYDVAGCIVGIVERRRIVDGSLVENGDIVIGLSSDGLHTNGYSLARRALLERGGRNVNDQVPELGVSLGEALLWQHRCYLKPVLKLLERDGLVHGMAHITGGGVIDNIPRILPNGLGVEIDTSAWTVPPLFKLIEQDGNIDSGEMYRVFNMGIGFVIVTAESRADEALKCLRESGETAMAIGRVVNGSDVVLV
jgi:phosphoribosylformylglycinamidine cyclo-ligase